MNKIPITKPYIGQEEIKAVQDVLTSGWLVQGEKVKEFERRIAKHEQVEYCCATTSCTTALQLAMIAEGLSFQMDVIVPSFTFVATANAVISLGATPVLVDVDSNTYNIDTMRLEKYILEKYVFQSSKWISKETENELWGIVPVHQFGLCADMHSINLIADKYKLHVVEDGACALGSKIEDIHMGGFGNTACVSFHPRKSITTGEGGMILTNKRKIYNKVVELRNHGSLIASDERHKNNGYLLPQYVSAGFNYRMTDIQGAIGCEQIEKLDYILRKRKEIASYYDELLGEEHKGIRVPYVPEGYSHSYQSYVCMLDFKDNLDESSNKRNHIMEGLEKLGVATRQGTHAIHKLDYYKEQFGFEDEGLPIANQCDALSISLPLYISMTKNEQEFVVERLIKLMERGI